MKNVVIIKITYDVATYLQIGSNTSKSWEFWCSSTLLSTFLICHLFALLKSIEWIK